jgi:ADP-glucose type glycogen/starch synthase
MSVRPPTFRILYAAAEAYPFAKVGGLGDVAGALPKALARLGHEVTLVIPAYRHLRREGAHVDACDVSFTGRTERVDVYRLGELGAVQVFALGDEAAIGREQVYGYEDDDWRFLLFARAVVTFAAMQERRPHVLHGNDWHLGLLPQDVRHGAYASAYASSATVFTIHNLMYQGLLTERAAALLGPEDSFEGPFLARGIAFADKVNTVSDAYLREILTAKGGQGLHGLLRSRADDLCGILNGIDYQEFDPSHDPHLPARYDAASIERKAENKRALQRRSGLEDDPTRPVIGMVARLVDQKGLDLVCAGLDRFVELGAQVVVMGVGEDRYRQALRAGQERLPGAMAFHDTDDEALARLVYAGSDLFLAPSNFEPCGLTPLIALRYGSIPVVRRTGGLAETVHDYRRDPETGLGFTFVRKYASHLVQTVREALALYRQPEAWRALQRRAMAADFSWERSSRAYERLYLEALRKRGALSSPNADVALQPR